MRKKIQKLYSELDETLWDIVVRKMDREKVNYFSKWRLSTKFLFCLWYLLFSLPEYLWWFFNKRLICLIKGCDIRYYHPFNTPDDVSNSFCKRCEASYEFGVFTTKYEFITR